MDKHISDKIKILSFICTVMVVIRHGFNLYAFGLNDCKTSYIGFIEYGVSKLTEIAVPYFFIVSGFFFLRYTYYSKSEYIHMLYKKMNSLFIPFLFWNIFGIIPLLLAHQFVFENTTWKYIIQLLHSDWNGVLWYVRDIMTLMVLVPLYAWIFVLNNRWLYGVVFLLLFINWIPVDCGWISTEGMLFFYLGGFLQKNESVISRRMPTFLLAIIGTAWIISCFFFPFKWEIHRYNTLLGLIIFWQMYHYIPKQISSWILNISAYSFFIFVTHLYIIKGIKLGVAHYFWGNEFIALLSYIFLPLLTIIIALYIGKKFNKFLPKVFNIVMGGRG